MGHRAFPVSKLDAVDGKQARRTGVAGPFGEMLDRGSLGRTDLSWILQVLVQITSRRD
ncbi:hypothetical protein EV401DRAFT_2023300 [Pisolithus croceorrhizus]|nr:hypothetical protein EV401DRAFT_2023300 [Pisolithus croceorrhizus]